MFEKHLPENEVRALISAAHNTNDMLAQRDAAMMRALLHSGCRITEFHLIDVKDAVFALNSRRLIIPKEHRKGGKRDHVVLVTAALESALQDLLKIREQITGSKTVDCGAFEALVVNRYCNRLSVRSFQLRVQFWACEAGLNKKVSPHWFRHTRGFNIMRKSNSTDPRGVVQQALGHASIATTGIYTQATEDEVRAALETTDAGHQGIRTKRDAMTAWRASHHAARGL